jgi:hypothetical protein
MEQFFTFGWQRKKVKEFFVRNSKRPTIRLYWGVLSVVQQLAAHHHLDKNRCCSRFGSDLLWVDELGRIVRVCGGI